REMKAQPIRFAPDAVAALAAYGWPGNIRESKNVVERCAVLADGAVIGARELRTISPLADRRSPVNQSDEKVLSGSLWDREKAAIEEALAETGFNQSAAARRLGIALHHLRYRIKKFGIRKP
ncbi:MAG: helix-turn-helix domain-containing protein, partial [Kiritimatiellae bacterium]|nr:helix-turn-helix domain-containing protein [Kiritimatiellia bacterium]